MNDLECCVREGLLRTCVAAAFAFLVGCAGFSSQPIEKGAAKSIRKIALVEMQEPASYVTNYYGKKGDGAYIAGSMFGMVGTMVAENAEQRLAKDDAALAAAMRERGFQFGRSMDDAVLDALAERGFVVMRVPDMREIKDGKPLFDYRRVDTDADAILNMTTAAVGYSSPSPLMVKYGPLIAVNLELALKEGNQYRIIYRDRFFYSWSQVGEVWVHLQASDTYTFQNLPTILSRGDLAVEGLRVGVKAIAEAVAREIAAGR